MVVGRVGSGGWGCSIWSEVMDLERERERGREREKNEGKKKSNGVTNRWGIRIKMVTF